MLLRSHSASGGAPFFGSRLDRIEQVMVARNGDPPPHMHQLQSQRAQSAANLHVGHHSGDGWQDQAEKRDESSVASRLRKVVHPSPLP